jgi:hypothetical protein
LVNRSAEFALWPSPENDKYFCLVAENFVLGLCMFLLMTAVFYRSVLRFIDEYFIVCAFNADASSGVDVKALGTLSMSCLCFENQHEGKVEKKTS